MPGCVVCPGRVETGRVLGMPISTIRRLRQGKELVGPVHSELLDFPPLPRQYRRRLGHKASRTSRASVSSPFSTVSRGLYPLDTTRTNPA
jgi:hypothetical protein